LRVDFPRKAGEIASDFDLTLAQANRWLKRLVDEGVVEKIGKPIRYQRSSAAASLFTAKLPR
jgi:DNA-binding Lrp family transcriptional regulator